jgi:cytochrome c nitrite reductase small subunit
MIRSPLRLLPLIAAATLGMLIAASAYTFIHAKGYSYITNDPAACANCHVMENHYRAWMKTHRSRGIRQISG